MDQWLITDVSLCLKNVFCDCSGFRLGRLAAVSESKHKRLLIEINTKIRSLNREIINPAIPELKLADFGPVMGMVARSRALYLAKLFALAEEVGEGMPTSDQIKSLRTLRVIYEELVTAAKALETAVERGYLDVLDASQVLADKPTEVQGEPPPESN
jgi:hypothetical protein